MNGNFAKLFLIVLGAVALSFGVFGDGFNFALALSGRRVEREQRRKRHVSPIVLAPVLFNGFGLMLICLALRLVWFWFIFGLVFIVLFHLAGLAAWRR